MMTPINHPVLTAGPITGPTLDAGTSSPSLSPSQLAASDQDQAAHMRRRLFRTLDHPERPIIAIDCATVGLDEFQSTTQQFQNDMDVRNRSNLVLAVPDQKSFADLPAFDCIQAVKQSAFENGFEGKVSWLLIEEPISELKALKNLVDRLGGKWCGSV